MIDLLDGRILIRGKVKRYVDYNWFFFKE